MPLYTFNHQWVTSTGVGAYVASERHALWTPKHYKADGTKHGVLYAPAKTQVGLDTLTDAIPAAFVEAGFPVIGADLGNLDGTTPQWGNDTAMSRVDSLWAWAKTNAGFKTDGVLVYGGSHGGLTMLNWTKRNTSIVRACAAVIPVMNLPYVHDNNVGTSAAGIETVYGGAGSYAANIVGHSPSELAGSMAGVPISIWYSDTDSDIFTPTHFFTDFAASCSSATITSQGAVGHTVTVDKATVAAFMTAHA